MYITQVCGLYNYKGEYTINISIWIVDDDFFFFFLILDDDCFGYEFVRHIIVGWFDKLKIIKVTDLLAIKQIL